MTGEQHATTGPSAAGWTFYMRGGIELGLVVPGASPQQADELVAEEATRMARSMIDAGDDEGDTLEQIIADIVEPVRAVRVSHRIDADSELAAFQWFANEAAEANASTPFELWRRAFPRAEEDADPVREWLDEEARRNAGGRDDRRPRAETR